MASAQDILDAVKGSNARLDQLNTEVLAATNATKAVDARVVEVDKTLTTGFVTLTADAQTLADLQAQATEILLHLTKQGDTIMCLLDKLARMNCAILNYAADQADSARATNEAVSALRDMYATTNPAAAVELARRDDLVRELERCCPPEPAQPVCTFEPCETPNPLRVDVPRPQLPQFPRDDIR